MTDAPERIWVAPWREGDWSEGDWDDNEGKTLNDKPCIQYGPIDRIEALKAEIAAHKGNAEANYSKWVEATARAEKTEAALKEAEDKLAQATWLLTEAAVQLEEGKIKTRRNRAAIIWNLLDEIKANDAP
jgi:hypothetical protein